MLPSAVGARGAAIAAGWSGSLTQGAGQFCTNPGIAVVIDGPDADAFVAAAKAAFEQWIKSGGCTAEVDVAPCQLICSASAAAVEAAGDEAAGMAASVANPLWRLLWALGHVKSDQEEVLIEGFYDGVDGPSRAESQALRALKDLDMLNPPTTTTNP